MGYRTTAPAEMFQKIQLELYFFHCAPSAAIDPDDIFFFNAFDQVVVVHPAREESALERCWQGVVRKYLFQDRIRAETG